MPPKNIKNRIYELRNHKVMLDFDLAELYEVETRTLNQAVKRNQTRFPADFMFQLKPAEWEFLTSQFVISKTIKSKTEKRGGNRKLPYAFTEQGLAMLSGILNSEKAVKINISIMRAFVALRQFALTNDTLGKKLVEIETKYDRQFKDIFEAINFLVKKKEMDKIQSDRERIGYKK